MLFHLYCQSVWLLHINKVLWFTEKRLDRVLFVIEKLSDGGAERVTALLAACFSEYNEFETFLCKFESNDKEYPVSKGVRQILKKRSYENSILEYLSQAFFLIKVIFTIQPDYVISLGMFSTDIMLALIGYFRNYKLIFSERSDPTRVPRKKIWQKCRNWAYNVADGLVLQTEYVKKLLPEKCIKKAVVIPNPISEVCVDKSSEKEPVIINCSRLIECKNLKLLIEVFSIVRKKENDYRLHIYGDGAQKEELLNYARQLGVSEYMTIFPFDENIKNVICRAGVYVSTSNFEGMSNSVLEAMSLGIPTIVTDCPVHSMRDIIVNNHNGIIVPANAKEDLVNSVLMVIQNDEFAKELSINGRKITERLNEKVIARRWVDYIKAL